MTPKPSIRVRIAPSPTGFLHVGTARTALFNWLYAKQQGGSFILRIEDTDLERSDEKFTQDIIENLKWLGLSWDEGPETANGKSQIANSYKGDYGPYRQTERLDSYEKYINQLLAEKKAYYCFCSKEDLEAERQAMLAQGMAPKYSGRCRTLKNAAEKLAAGESHVIRFHSPNNTMKFTDMIRGEISFDLSLMGDFAIAKDPRVPLYNFAVVIDDHEMKISHVIRGEDHIPNTPKQIALQEALGFSRPHYAHLPLILDPDRSKMSKRFSATSIAEYRKEGYLPEALLNFMALLGWHPKDDKEILTVDEIIKEFDLKRIQKAGAIFNKEKLDWLNAHYLRNMKEADLLKKINEIHPIPKGLTKKQSGAVLSLTKKRMNRLTDFHAESSYFFELPNYDTPLLAWKNSSTEITKQKLSLAKELLTGVAENKFEKEELERSLMPLAEKEGRGDILWPLRIAISGLKDSSGPFEILDVLGKEESLRRIDIALEKLR